MPALPTPTLPHAEATLRHYSGEYEAHAHEHAQVLVGLRGSLMLEAGGRSALVDAGTALVVPAGISHGYFAERPASVLVIDAPMRRGLEHLRRFVPPALWRDALRTRAPGFDAEAALDQIGSAPKLLQRRRIDLAALEAALHERLHEPWSTARLAALAHLSAQRFHARFVELTGQPPAAWLRARRLDQAERLLRAGLSLEAAALQAGYASASALGFALKRDRDAGARRLRSARSG